MNKATFAALLAALVFSMLDVCTRLNAATPEAGSETNVRAFKLPGADGAAAWELGPDVTLESEGGSTFIRCGSSDFGQATRAIVTSIVVKPRTGYVARCRFRSSGDAQLTFAVLQPAGKTFDSGNYFDEHVEKMGAELFERGLAFYASRDEYLNSLDVWEQIELPFRTGDDQREIGLYVGRRYGAQAIDYDSVELVEDDSVIAGEIIPSVNPFPQASDDERSRGFIVSRQHWMQPVFPAHAPARNEIDPKLDCWLSPGEREPLTFAMTGLRELRDVGVALAGDMRSADGNTLSMSQVEIGTVRTITRWLTNGSPVSPGQRYEKRPLFIFPNEKVILGPKETKTWWLTIHAPENQPPGLYRGSIVIRAEGASGYELPISVEVLPIKLSEPSVTYGMYYRHSEQPAPYKNEEMYLRSARDMKEHGMNSASVYAQLERKLPDGTWVTDLDHGGEDFYSLNRQMAMLNEAGLARPGHPLLLLPSHNQSDGIRDLSNTLQYQTTLPALAARRAEAGWPELLLYLFDEVGAKPSQWESLDAEMRIIDAARKANPACAIRLTTAAPGEKSHYYDVIIRGDREPGKEMWTYNCSWNGSQPMNDRFFAGLHTWSEQLTGNWQWCYTENRQLEISASGEIQLGKIGAYADPWNVNYVIPSKDRNIPTLGWEGRREGIDDYRYLQTLAESIKLAESASDPEVRDNARDAVAFLDRVSQRSKVPPVEETPSQINSSRPYFVIMHPGLAYSDYDGVRREAAEWIMRLGQ